jgi:hypothetical protein
MKTRAGDRVEKSRRPTISEVRKKSTDQATRFDQNWSALVDHWSTIIGRPKPTDQIDDHWLTTSVTQVQVFRRPEVIFLLVMLPPKYVVLIYLSVNKNQRHITTLVLCFRSHSSANSVIVFT